VPFQAAQPDVDRGEVDGGFVTYGQLVEASGHAAVLLEQVDAALHGVALFVGLCIERGRPATTRAELAPIGGLILLDRDDAPDPTAPQIGPVALRAVRLVTQYPIRPGTRPASIQTRYPDTFQHGSEVRAVSALPSGDQDRQWLAALLAAQMQLGGPATPRAPQRVVSRLHAGNSAGWLLLQIPFFRAPAACWCARAIVESTLTSQVISPTVSARACSPVRIRCQVPSRCQRRNRPYTVCQGPYRGGTSRQGDPTRNRHRIPSINCRLLHLGGRPGFLPLGSNGSSTAHCASVRSARAVTGMVSTRSPGIGLSWSKNHLPETSLLFDHRHAHRQQVTALTSETRPSRHATSPPRPPQPRKTSTHRGTPSSIDARRGAGKCVSTVSSPSCSRWQNSVVPAPTERLANRVRRDFPADRADEVIGWLSGLPANAFGGQDPERVQAALVLAAAGQWSRFLAGVDLLRQDWRDVLVSGDLADEDWPVRLDAELP
jgi:hypothetical protein